MRKRLFVFLVLMLCAVTLVFSSTRFEESLTRKKSGSTALEVMPGGSMYVYNLGADVGTGGTSPGTVIPVYDSSTLKAGDTIEINGSTATVLTVDSSTQITVDSALTFTALDRILRTSSEVAIYSDPSLSTSITQPAIASSAGKVLFWWNAATAADFDIKVTSGGSSTIYANAASGGAGASSFQVYDIRLYGASTGATDNSTSIGAAKDAACAAGGGVVYVPPGTWTVKVAGGSGTQADPYYAIEMGDECDDVAIIGSGQSVSVLDGSTATATDNNKTMVRLLDCERCGVESVELDGNDAWGNGVRNVAGDFVVIRDVWAHDFSNHGVAFRPSPADDCPNDGLIENVRAQGDQTGIIIFSTTTSVGGGPYTCKPARNRIINSQGYGAATYHGLEVRYSQYTQILGGSYTGNAGSGILLEEETVFTTIKGVNATGNTENGIVTFGLFGKRVADVVVSDSVLDANTAHGFRCGRSDRIRISNTFLTNNGEQGYQDQDTNGDCVDVDDPQDCCTGLDTGTCAQCSETIFDNVTITGNDQWGINLRGNDHEVRGGVISGNGTNPGQAAGIRMDPDTVERFRLDGARVEDNIGDASTYNADISIAKNFLTTRYKISSDSIGFSFVAGLNAYDENVFIPIINAGHASQTDQARTLVADSESQSLSEVLVMDTQYQRAFDLLLTGIVDSRTAGALTLRARVKNMDTDAAGLRFRQGGPFGNAAFDAVANDYDVQLDGNTTPHYEWVEYSVTYASMGLTQAAQCLGTPGSRTCNQGAWAGKTGWDPETGANLPDECDSDDDCQYVLLGLRAETGSDTVRVDGYFIETSGAASFSDIDSDYGAETVDSDWNFTDKVGLPVVTVANLPTSPSAGDSAYVTDGTTTVDCTVGGGSTWVECSYTNGGAWAAVSGGGAGHGNGANCVTAGQFPDGVDQTGAVEDCAYPEAQYTTYAVDVDGEWTDPNPTTVDEALEHLAPRVLANDAKVTADATNVNAAGAVMETDFDAQTILAATADNTPLPLTVNAQNLVGRVTAGNVASLNATQVLGILGVEAGATANPSAIETDQAGEIAGLATVPTGVPASGDFLMLEDVDDGNNKKKFTVGNLPPGSVNNLSSLTDWTAATTKKTTDIVFDGVEADFNTGTGKGWPQLAQDSDPNANYGTDCDEASEYGRLMFDTDLDTDGSTVQCTASGWKDIDDDGATGSGAFNDAADPVVLNTPAKTVEIGGNGTPAAQAKLEVNGDANEVQFRVEANATQGSNIVEIINSGDTQEHFTVGNTGKVIVNESGTGLGVGTFRVEGDTEANLFNVNSTAASECASFFGTGCDEDDEVHVGGKLTVTGTVSAGTLATDPSAQPTFNLEDSSFDDGDTDFQISIVDSAVSSNDTQVDISPEIGGALQSWIHLDGINKNIEIGNASSVSSITLLSNATGEAAFECPANSIDWDEVDDTLALGTATNQLAANQAFWGTTGILFEGSGTNDGFQTLITAANPTADRTITLKNESGTVALTSDLHSQSHGDADHTNDALDADKITGDTSDDDDLDVAAGGTGVSTLTDHGVLLGSGAGDVSVTAAGGANEVLMGQAGADPIWVAQPAIDCTNCTGITATATGITGATDSDVNIRSDMDVIITLDDDADGQESFQINGGDDQLKFGVTELGDVEVYGTNASVELTGHDTFSDCTAFGTSGGIFYDLSDAELKKCENGSLTKLDTTGGTPSFGTLTGGTNTAATMVVGTGASLAVSGTGTITANGVDAVGVAAITIGSGDVTEITLQTDAATVTDAEWGLLDGLTTLSGSNTGDEAAASQSVAGIVELADNTETNAGASDVLAVRPAGLAAWTGSANVTTLGTITTGTWQGTTVAVANGGTGATSLTTGGVLLGGNPVADTGVLGNGVLLIGDAAGAPTQAAMSGDATMTNAGLVTVNGVQTGALDVALTTAGDVGVSQGDDAFDAHFGSTGEISGEASISAIQKLSITIDPGAHYDVLGCSTTCQVFLTEIGDEAPNGIIIDEWSLSCNVDPDVEPDLDLKRASAWIGLTSATVIDVLDTTAGVSSEDTDANINAGAAVANGQHLYLEFDSDPEGTCQQMIFTMWWHAEED